jgi:hypothetical protein
MTRQTSGGRLAALLQWALFVAAVFTLGLVPTRKP